jgi:hypothetical protein
MNNNQNNMNIINTVIEIENDSTLECPICFEYLENNNKTKCCKQLIHEECLDKCNYSCPFCRQKIVVNKNIISQNPLRFDEYYNTHEIEVRISRYFRWRKYFFLILCCFLVAWVPGVLVYQVEQNNILIRKKNNITINY